MRTRSTDHTTWHADRHDHGETATDGGDARPVAGGCHGAPSGSDTRVPTPDTATDADGVERTVVEGGVLRSAGGSHRVDVDVDGTVVTQEGSSC